MRYFIVSQDEGQTLDEFEESVTEHINKGWNLYGNPFIDTAGYFYQAITLYEPTKDETLPSYMKRELASPEEIIAAVNSPEFDRKLLLVGP